jgi:LacI family transcriptional regulator
MLLCLPKQAPAFDTGSSQTPDTSMLGHRVRLKDIADATGFSVNTVSLALRGSPRIPTETRDLILADAKRQGYLPNQVARSLVSRATKTIGLVLPDVMNPTLTFSALCLERQLAADGFSMMFAVSNNLLAQEKKVLEVFRSHQLDGILLYPVSHRQLDHIRPLRKAGYPILLLVADPDAGIDVVCVDERRGAFQAVAHLLGLGHKRIAMIDPAPALGNSEKADGYERALRSYGIEVDPLLVIDPGGHGPANGYSGMADLMKRKHNATALFASNDMLAIGALRWCREHGVSVPQDLAVVGFDDIEAADFTDVPLTTMHYGVDEVADHAVKRLLTLIRRSGDAPEPQMTLIEPRLVIRQSCGASLRTDKPAAAIKAARELLPNRDDHRAASSSRRKRAAARVLGGPGDR